MPQPCPNVLPCPDWTETRVRTAKLVSVQSGPPQLQHLKGTAAAPGIRIAGPRPRAAEAADSRRRSAQLGAGGPEVVFGLRVGRSLVLAFGCGFAPAPAEVLADREHQSARHRRSAAAVDGTALAACRVEDTPERTAVPRLDRNSGSHGETRIGPIGAPAVTTLKGHGCGTWHPHSWSSPKSSGSCGFASPVCSARGRRSGGSLRFAGGPVAGPRPSPTGKPCASPCAGVLRGGASRAVRASSSDAERPGGLRRHRPASAVRMRWAPRAVRPQRDLCSPLRLAQLESGCP